MIAPAGVALVLLAAGRSTRFGAEDKLAAPLAGIPLGLHAARALAALPFAARIAIVGRPAVDFAAAGFEVLVNDDPAAGQARSVRLGVQAARRSGCAAILLTLADMPFVSARHVTALLGLYDDPSSILASSAGALRSPPALFGHGWFDALERLHGDRGAGSLLGEARLVAIDADELLDVDTPADLVAMEALARRHGPGTAAA